MIGLLLLSLASFPADFSQGKAASAEPIRYTLRFPDRRNHYVEVEVSYPAEADRTVLMMAVWTPGSYLVREYARHVEGLEAHTEGGDPLPIEKTRKNRWRVSTEGHGRFLVRYRLYCREMSVRTNWVEESFAILNGAPTFVTLLDSRHPHDVLIQMPADWKQSVTGLPPHPDNVPHHYRAADYDTLVDSPLLAGNPTVHEFEVDGIPHVLANQGEGGIWDGPRSAEDVRKIVEVQTQFWGVIPYERYVFLNLITEAGGGLEHKNSTLMMTSRWRSRIKKDYLGWLGLVSHEFFHTWNVKRLRPRALGPFDYEKEVHTRSLWIAEGITSYYDDLLLARAGLSTRKEYLKALSKQIERLQTTPGRRVHALEQASYDAWIKHYRRDENSPNSTISYYTKGAVVGFLLDAKIRRVTDDARSLDDVLRRCYERFSGHHGYTPEDFRQTVEEVADADLGPWWTATLETTEELDYNEALDWFGLRFKNPDEKEKDTDNDEADERSDAGSEPDEREEDEERPDPGWLGITTRNDGGRLLITQVKRETPGYRFGLNVDDEIIAIDQFRVTADGWKKRLEQYRPGDEAVLLIARRDLLLERPVEFGKKPGDLWRLAIVENADEAQRKRLESWLRVDPGRGKNGARTKEGKKGG